MRGAGKIIEAARLGGLYQFDGMLAIIVLMGSLS
jgi:hypothetical protein